MTRLTTQPTHMIGPLLLVVILNLTTTSWGLLSPNYIGSHYNYNQSNTFQLAKQWKLFTYNFLPQAPVNDPNFYNPLNVLATGIAVTNDRIFIATPKLFSGVPSTLNFVSKAHFGDSPVLQAYPDWSFSTTGRTDFNCSDLVLISVYRLRIDSCNRLWVLDAGVSRSLEDYEITCPPKILIIDLNTNQVVRRVDFPAEILRGESLFTNLVIDETTSKSPKCDDVFVYISDTVEPGLIVYDSGRDVTWRVSHPAMYPDPDFAQSEILNYRFILMDGVVGLAFDEKAGIVYFQPLATDRVFSVTKEVLRAGPLGQNENLDVKLLGKKSSQGIGLAVSPIDGSLIFSPLTETAIAAWNPSTGEQQLLAQNPDHVQFVADITLTRSEPDAIYAIASKFHRFYLKNVDPKEFNNRILRLELPGANLISPSYALKPLVTRVPQYSSFYHHHTNTIEKPQHIPPAADHSYFQSPQHPYSYEPVGVINYSLKNPFNALNTGESFPPSKENRDTHQRSYLDSLAAVRSVPAARQTLRNVLPAWGGQGQGQGYYYSRELRSVKSGGPTPTPSALMPTSK